jgi:hypothetical protein
MDEGHGLEEAALGAAVAAPFVAGLVGGGILATSDGKGWFGVTVIVAGFLWTALARQAFVRFKASRIKAVRLEDRLSDERTKVSELEAEVSAQEDRARGYTVEREGVSDLGLHAFREVRKPLKP